MMQQRIGSGRERRETANHGGAVRASDLIRAQRAPVAPWSVFVDNVDDARSEQRRPEPRDSLVRRRPTEWDVVDDKSDSNKENIGYEVRRPKRGRRSLQPSQDDEVDEENDENSSHVRRTTQLPALSSTSAPKSNGKRKLQAPTPPKEKTSKKTKLTTAKSEPEVRAEPSMAPPTTPERARRPLEDITHLFIDPTAHYFQPWRRAVRVATLRASSMRIL